MRALALALGKLRRLGGSRDGNLMIMFGLGAIMLFCCAGVGIDMARAYTVRLRLNAALDAAGLAVAAMSSNTSQTQQQAQLQNFFTANYPQGSLGNADGFAPLIKPSMTVSGQTITVTAQTTVKTLFMQVFPGLNSTMTVGASSTIKKGTGLELALALDNTGSMFANSGSGSTTNIQALQQDTVTLIQTLFSQTTNQSQLFISIVPFVTTVNLPPQLASSGIVQSQQNPFTGDPSLTYDASQTNDAEWKGCPLENAYPNDINPTQQTWPGQYLWGTFNYQTADASLNDTQVNGSNIAKFNANNSDNVLTSPPLPAANGGPSWNTATANPNKLTVANAAGKSPPFVTAGVAPLPSSAPNLWAATTTTNQTGFDGNSDKVPLSTVHTNFFTASDNSDCNLNAAKNKDCPTQITPLTNDETTLVNAANAMQAWCQSGTMIHIGLAWAWRTIEPNGVFNTLTNPPHDYNDTNWLKALVLMTDGQDTLFQGCDQTYSYNSGAYLMPGNANNTANPNGGGISPTAGVGAPYTNHYGPNIDIKVGGSTKSVATETQFDGCIRGGNSGQNAVFYPPLSGMTPYGRVGDPGAYIGVGVPDPTNGMTPSVAGATTTSNGKPLLDEEVAEACAALKEDGVRVYTIAFTGAAANSITMLQTCASDPNKTFFNAPTQAALQTAFAAIAQDLNKIRVAQ